MRCELAIIDLEFPGGLLPAEGYRCPVCGDELFTGDQVDANQRRARELCLYGPEQSSRRKLRQVGSSLSVTIDPELLEALIPGAKAGDEVVVAREGSKITIRALPKK